MVGGLIKGLRVIETFDRDHPRLAISDVARETDMDRATCRRLLLTLVSLGYAEHDGKFFKLTPRILRLGYSYLHTASLPSIVQPLLEQMSRETEESCSVSVLDGQSIVYIARASRQRVMSINLNVGSRLPAYCSSMGRALLAFMPPDQARKLLEKASRPALTAKTITEILPLMAELAKIKRQGYAIIDEELELGLRSIALPLYDNRGNVVAALNIGAQAARVSVKKMRDSFLPHLLHLQADLRQVYAPD
ncbi:helix-turn-helix domain-containing protein [Acidisoma cellulosilytica]|uniref:Helix-turn-helix domain-containing protein n=2 Tax=Acidisoma cellulosilyticum TaxID=2802395 RepID=A0A963Z822_9PROT|nr:helix-turn-helix domain-containing protein [Acidisoma cellulosilyticum]